MVEEDREELEEDVEMEKHKKETLGEGRTRKMTRK